MLREIGSPRDIGEDDRNDAGDGEETGKKSNLWRIENALAWNLISDQTAGLAAAYRVWRIWPTICRETRSGLTLHVRTNSWMRSNDATMIDLDFPKNFVARFRFTVVEFQPAGRES